MAELTQIGILRRIGESNFFGANNFEVRKFILEVPSDNENYPDSEFLEFQLKGNSCDRIANFSVGDEIEVYFNIKGRKHSPMLPDGTPKLDDNGKPITNVYNSLNAYRLSAQTQEGQDGAQEQQNNGLNNEHNNTPVDNNNNNQGHNSPPAQNNNPQHPNLKPLHEDYKTDEVQDIPF